MSKTSKGLVLVLLLTASPTYADGVANPPAPIDLSAFAKQSDLAAVQSLIMSAIPLPSDSEPSGDAGAGSTGAAIRYLRADSIRPSQSRSVMVTLDANGVGSGTWKSPFKSALPIPGAVSPINTAAAVLQISCDFIALSQSSFSVKCTQQLLAPSVSTMVTAPLNSPASAGTQVGVTAMEQSP